LALIVAAFGYGATLLGRRTPAVAAAETAPPSNAATEALVGRHPPLDTPPAAASRTTVSGSDHAVPFSIAETPTFAMPAARSNGVDASSERPGQPKPGAMAAREANAPRTEEELRAAMRRVSVTVYSTDWCPVCTKARAWLRANGVSFEERDVDKSETARRMQLSLNPKGGVPTIDIDGEVMIGFGAPHMQAALRRAAERRARKF
jgi:glutaredoxin